MTYFKQYLLVIMLLLFTCQTFAFYHEEWHKLNTDSQYAAVDIYSINRHNDSIYYALKYCKQATDEDIDNCRVVIIQSKDNKAGKVQTYQYKEYSNLLYKSISRPAYDAQEAESFKDIEKGSLTYLADEYAKQYMAEYGNLTPSEARYQMHMKTIEKANEKLRKEIKAKKEFKLF